MSIFNTPTHKAVIAITIAMDTYGITRLLVLHDKAICTVTTPTGFEIIETPTAHEFTMDFLAMCDIRLVAHNGKSYDIRYKTPAKNDIFSPNS